MRIAKFIFRAPVVAIWATVAYACVDRIGQEIEFNRAMGGLP